jgi:hypothetical protein
MMVDYRFASQLPPSPQLLPIWPIFHLMWPKVESKVRSQKMGEYISQLGKQFLLSNDNKDSAPFIGKFNLLIFHHIFGQF